MAAIIVKYHFNTEYGNFATIGCKKTLGDGCLIVSLGTQNKSYVMANFDTFVRKCLYPIGYSIFETKLLPQWQAQHL